MLFNPGHEASHRRPISGSVDAATGPAFPDSASLESLRAAASDRTVRLDQLMKAGAWTDAALALMKLELPGWQLLRLVQDDGEWFCPLSRQLAVPAELDDTSDGCHGEPALAIWSAMLEARRRIGEGPRSGSVPSIRRVSGHQVCCDNFA
jgi:hypothetical protein